MDEHAQPTRLEEHDARLRLFFERSSDAILLLDTATNHFVQYNAAALEMLRCTREELAALHPSALSPKLQPDGQDSFTRANEMIATAIERGSHRFEWTHCSPHRGDFPVEVVLTLVTRGETPEVMVVWRDLTERKRAEEAQRQSQKLESLGLLAGGIAHDFNNLLTAIVGNLGLARAELPEDSNALEHLGHMEAAAQKAAHLTRQMLAYSGHSTFSVSPVDLGREVREMAELLGASVPKSARLLFELQPGLSPVMADQAQLGQVIMNLVLNAAESLPGGQGTITLSTAQVTLGDDQRLRDVEEQHPPPGPYVVLKVQDTGCGMTRAVQARIFDPFFSTKRTGRGLGLSALLGIVKSHKGCVLLDSVEHRGTAFQVFLPASHQPLGQALPVAPATSALAAGSVLLVEDEPMVRRSTRHLLEALGFSVLEACDGDEAIALFKTNPPGLAWVLMDLTMPRMDGHTAFLALRELDPAVKVVLSSGWAAADVADRFQDHPPAGFLSKPFVLQDVREALERAGIISRPR